MLQRRQGREGNRPISGTSNQKFTIAIQAAEEREPTMDPEEKELRREVVNLHQRWGKVIEESANDETKERARISDVEKQGFIRMVQRNVFAQQDRRKHT
jgi:hypothetical protein